MSTFACTRPKSLVWREFDAPFCDGICCGFISCPYSDRGQAVGVNAPPSCARTRYPPSSQFRFFRPQDTNMVSYMVSVREKCGVLPPAAKFLQSPGTHPSMRLCFHTHTPKNIRGHCCFSCFRFARSVGLPLCSSTIVSIRSVSYAILMPFVGQLVIHNTFVPGWAPSTRNVAVRCTHVVPVRSPLSVSPAAATATSGLSE